MNYYYVYFLTNSNKTVLYIGVTNDLSRRVSEHKSKLIKGFTSQYSLSKLVYYEDFNDVQQAIAREKQLKKWARVKKDRLIEAVNPFWKDLSDEDPIM
ncbi:MAG: GIY-YIG nuclease family protein [Candidatus Jacksonbacteria bacterium]|nr:GIY-YIG nuclease family protein [Candidatus Jacksonbacteria bacterium]